MTNEGPLCRLCPEWGTGPCARKFSQDHGLGLNFGGQPVDLAVGKSEFRGQDIQKLQCLDGLAQESVRILMNLLRGQLPIRTEVVNTDCGQHADGGEHKPSQPTQGRRGAGLANGFGTVIHRGNVHALPAEIVINM